jgi:hypothetical protein
MISEVAIRLVQKKNLNLADIFVHYKAKIQIVNNRIQMMLTIFWGSKYGSPVYTPIATCCVE